MCEMVSSFPSFSCHIQLPPAGEKEARKPQNSRKGKERKGHSHMLHELGHILNHAAQLQLQVYFQLCSGMLAAKWSSPVHVVTREKDYKKPLAAATPCLYSIAVNSRLSLTF